MATMTVTLSTKLAKAAASFRSRLPCCECENCTNQWIGPTPPFSVEQLQGRLDPGPMTATKGGTAEISDWLCRKTRALAIFNGTERATGELDPIFVVPTDA